MIVSNKCPYCGLTMENGFLAGNAAIWWTKKSPNILMTRNGGNIRLARSYTKWAHLRARRCSNCKITIVMDD